MTLFRSFWLTENCGYVSNLYSGLTRTIQRTRPQARNWLISEKFYFLIPNKSCILQEVFLSRLARHTEPEKLHQFGKVTLLKPCNN
jgi:hypothetical protein